MRYLNYEAILQFYVLRVSMVLLSVFRVLDPLSCDIKGMVDVLHSSSILESSGSTYTPIFKPNIIRL